MLKVYGLKTCDTCRKALQWLTQQKIPHNVIDVRTDGLSKADITRFANAIGWEKLLNKASTSWRALSEAEKEGVTEAKAIALMHKYPTLIKRPVFEAGKIIMAGFKDAEMKVLKALK